MSIAIDTLSSGHGNTAIDGCYEEYFTFLMNLQNSRDFNE